MRTHEKEYQYEYDVAQLGNREARKLLIDGRHFESIKQACKKLKVGTGTMYRWIDSGRAQLENR